MNAHPNGGFQITLARALARDRARALATNLSAVAEGVLSPTPDMLNALSHLAWSTALDLEVGAEI